MGINREALLKRYKKNTQQGNKGNSRRFRPSKDGGPKKDGKYTVRLMPWNPKDDEDDWLPFKDLYFYYGLANYGILSLTQFDEDDPVQELINELREDDAEGNKATLRKLYPKRRIFAPVIVRGEEEKGVQWWQFGPSVEKDILEILMDEEYGDVLSFEDGRDIKVTVTQKQGESYPTTSCSVRVKQSSLGDEDEIEKWVDDMPDLSELYERKTYDEIKTVLDKWLGADEDDDDDGVEHTQKAAKKAAKKPSVEMDDDDDDDDVDAAFADLSPDDD